MEELYPGISTKIKDVFDDFTTQADGGRIPHKLKDVDKRYRSKEQYYEPRDKSLVPDAYCTKIYSDDKTESFSMFLEEFMDNPLYIVSNYREWYERMIKCCK